MVAFSRAGWGLVTAAALCSVHFKRRGKLSRVRSCGISAGAVLHPWEVGSGTPRLSISACCLRTFVARSQRPDHCPPARGPQPAPGPGGRAGWDGNTRMGRPRVTAHLQKAEACRRPEACLPQSKDDPGGMIPGPCFLPVDRWPYFPRRLRDARRCGPGPTGRAVVFITTYFSSRARRECHSQELQSAGGQSAGPVTAAQTSHCQTVAMGGAGPEGRWLRVGPRASVWAGSLCASRRQSQLR
ncbi:uncharacterized protein LOC116663000 [Camelus ferus]|uniref:Uncharacterized protein LOC116663000 n=1 Tax=Camelus ferus TaxID=419612 RepID=A0A8B8STL8_CAMFR|nr:uncharacterized protein LOC116663000 [Camelus ferus]